MLALLLATALAASAQPGSPTSGVAGASPDGTTAESSPAVPRVELNPDAGPFDLRVAALPLVSYGSNVGLQLGSALLFYKVPRGGGVRRDWLALGVSWATRGPRSLEGKGERFALLGTRMRAYYQLKLALDELSPYWGEGARLVPGVDAGAGSPPPEHRYKSVGPWASVLVRHPLENGAGPWHAFGRVRFRKVDIESAGSALEAASPPGVHGGTLTLLHAGALHDTRDDEIFPTRGTFSDLSLFGTPPGVGSAAMGGVNAGVRGYRSVAPGITLAARAMYELKGGTVPFFERTQLEGIDYGEGLGGPDTIRGIARARLAGDEKLLVNLEVRAMLLTVRPGGRPLELGLGAGGDAGRARQRGYTPVWAAGAFGGLRAIWDRALVVRLEGAMAGHGLAVYLALDESF